MSITLNTQPSLETYLLSSHIVFRNIAKGPTLTDDVHPVGVPRGAHLQEMLSSLEA